MVLLATPNVGCKAGHKVPMVTLGIEIGIGLDIGLERMTCTLYMQTTGKPQYKVNVL